MNSLVRDLITLAKTFGPHQPQNKREKKREHEKEEARQGGGMTALVFGHALSLKAPDSSSCRYFPICRRAQLPKDRRFKPVCPV